jgi:hypothetical protein
MELIIESGLLRPQAVQPLHTEASELAKIMAKSRISASATLRQSKVKGTGVDSKVISNRQSAIGNRQ